MLPHVSIRILRTLLGLVHTFTVTPQLSPLHITCQNKESALDNCENLSLSFHPPPSFHPRPSATYSPHRFDHIANTMDPFRSKNLQYRSYNSPEDDDFFHSIQSDPIAFSNSCASLMRPVDRRFTDNIKNHLLENSLLFVVIYKTVGDPVNHPQPERIGTLFLKSASPDMVHHRCAEFGIDIKKEFQGRGYGTEAIHWMLDWAFRYAGLHRVECHVFGWNTRALRIYQMIGFREEGRRRECLFKDGQWWHEVHLGILKKEWRQ